MVAIIRLTSSSSIKKSVFIIFTICVRLFWIKSWTETVEWQRNGDCLARVDQWICPSYDFGGTRAKEKGDKDRIWDRHVHRQKFSFVSMSFRKKNYVFSKTNHKTQKSLQINYSIDSLKSVGMQKLNFLKTFFIKIH